MDREHHWNCVLGLLLVIWCCQRCGGLEVGVPVKSSPERCLRSPNNVCHFMHLPLLKKRCASREFCPHPFKCCCLSFSKSLLKSHCLAAGEGNLIIHSCSGSIAAGSPLHWQDWDCLSLCNRQLLAWMLCPQWSQWGNSWAQWQQDLAFGALSSSLLRPPSGHFFLVFLPPPPSPGSQLQHQCGGKANVVIKKCNRILPYIRRNRILYFSYRCIITNKFSHLQGLNVCERKGLEKL